MENKTEDKFEEYQEEQYKILPEEKVAVYKPIEDSVATYTEQINLNSTTQAIKNIVESGTIKGITSMEKAFVVAKFGRELGMDLMTSLNNLDFIEGKVTLKAQTMLGIVQGRKIGKVEVIKDFERVESKEGSKEPNFITILRFTRYDNEVTQDISYSFKEAEIAGLLTKTGGAWSKYPKDMLYNRCLTRGMRRVFADIFGNVYDPEEINS